MKKFILITGGAGFIGSYICRELLKKGEYTPLVVDVFNQYIEPLKDSNIKNRCMRLNDIKDKIIIKRANCAKYPVMRSIIEEYKPEYIIHLAAVPLAKIKDTSVEEFREGTVDATENILNIISDLKQKRYEFLKKFVYTSSSMVYGNFLEDYVKENHPTEPINVYGTMKLAGETVTRGLCNSYDIKHIIIRPSAVYGPTDINGRVSQIFIENAFQDKKLIVKGTNERLDFSYVKDVAKGFVQATLSDCSNEIFNLTRGESRLILEFAQIVKKYFPKIEIEVLQERDKEIPKRGALDIIKARKIFNYSPEYSLEKGIKECIEYIREHKLIEEK